MGFCYFRLILYVFVRICDYCEEFVVDLVKVVLCKEIFREGKLRLLYFMSFKLYFYIFF